MNDYSKQHKKAWEFDAYNFWVEHAGKPEERAKEDIDNPVKMLRKYTAYFAEDIPVSYGPWKLQGLPGLILEAYDSEGRIHFTAERIIPLEGTISRAKYPYIRVTRKEYAQMVQQMQEHYKVFANNHISRAKIIRVGLDDTPEPVRQACIPLERDQ